MHPTNYYNMPKKSKKGMLLPPAIGYSFKIVLDLIRKNKIQLKYVPKLIAIVIVNLINYPFRSYERLFINPNYYKKTIDHSPVFIIGHWRSGTTHLHNLLCQDDQMAFVTTYQSVFPDTLFNKFGRFLFRGFSTLLIPGTRKGDNVTLGASLPQEEEFALGDKTPLCFYFFWMFPTNMIQYYNDFIRFNNIDLIQLDRWKADYKLLIKKAIKNTNKKRYLSKNPPNTGRVKILLEMFPDAKFIHIHRKPIEVFLSTQNFYKKMLPPLQLQSISSEEIDLKIQDIYKKIMNDFIQQKESIPKGNLIEISYNELEKNPINTLNEIYTTLNIDNYDIALNNFETYVDKLKSYKKNRHKIKKNQLDILIKAWGFIMEKYNYSIPTGIEIVD